jgi:hypothetical protein
MFTCHGPSHPRAGGAHGQQHRRSLFLFAHVGPAQRKRISHDIRSPACSSAPIAERLRVRWWRPNIGHLPTVCSLSACIAAELGIGTPAEKHLTAELTFPLFDVSFARPAFAA